MAHLTEAPHGAQMKSLRRHWIGERYDQGIRSGLKLLLVGDSHYVDEDDPIDLDRLTVDAVERGAITGRWPFFEHLRETALGLAPLVEAREFWHRVAYVNLVQDIMASSAQAPTAEQFEAGWLSLREHVAELQPDLMLCLLYTSPSPRDRQKSRMPSSA